MITFPLQFILVLIATFLISLILTPFVRLLAHFAGHCLGRTELDGGHGDEIREATGDHRAAGE